MFNAGTYSERRKRLREKVESGVILIPGNNDTPMNYPGNPYYFRQDSSFLYFFGLDKPGFTGLIDIDEDKDYLYGVDLTVDDIIWMGPQPAVRETALAVGVEDTGTPDDLAEKIRNAISSNRKVHFLPQYRADTILQLEKLLGIPNSEVKNRVSEELIRAVVSLRSFKTDDEINEIEEALVTTCEMYSAALQMAQPGVNEAEIVGKMEGILGSQGKRIAFPIILSIHGEILHNHHHENVLQENDLLVVDSGAESLSHYASDITRTYPVGGRFTPEQKEIYQIVLNGQLTAIEAMKPEITYKEIHLKTAAVMAEGLKDMGFIKGDIASVVEAGAHALFFPHGLGHMMGLDVHDMENYGEDNVGYDETITRSGQFGLAYLRMAKTLKPGHVITVEPGIYFIPALIDQWKTENKFSEFINYAKVEEFKGFGGVRIEDDVLVTADEHRVLGKPIPKKTDEIEEIMAGAV